MKGRVKRADLHSSAENAFGKWRRLAVLALAVSLLAAFTVGGTLAYLKTNTDPVENRFTPTNVSCAVHETFANNEKTSITVQNTGNTDAYVRVRLVTYRVNADGDRIGGAASIGSFLLNNADWIKEGDYYYCRTALAPDEVSLDLLSSGSIQLATYNDADGGKQVIEVMAEAIQSEPVSAVAEAWTVNIYSAGN